MLFNKRLASRLTPTVSVGLLVAMGIGSLTRTKPKDIEPYHQAVRDAVGALPMRIGSWVGTDNEIPRAAIQLLHPNVLFNRKYRNLKTGHTATLMLVHCKDARDIAGHYPPICYPAHGWTLESDKPDVWLINDLEIHGTEYGFSFDHLGETTRTVIQNFMVMPNGQILPDMQGVRKAAADYTRHFYGAAQIQLVTRADIPKRVRDAFLQELLGPNEDLIETLRSGESI